MAAPSDPLSKFIDLRALAAQLDTDLDLAFSELRALYHYVDERNDANSAALDLPCGKGCDACCHESVFLTPLGFFYVWDHLQREVDDATRAAMVRKGLDLYAEHRETIEALSEPPPEGERDHYRLARDLKFTCPLLAPGGVCGAYAARELYARMFGCSFLGAGSLYGCDLVGTHLAGKSVTLLKVRDTAELLNELPLTYMRQVYPYYFHLLYGDAGDS